MSQFTAGPNPTGIDRPDPAGFREQKRQEREDAPGFYEALGAAFDRDGLVTGIGRFVQNTFESRPEDTGWSIFDLDNQQQDILLKDVDPADYDYVAEGRTVSEAWKRRSRILNRRAIDKIIDDAGTAGTIAAFTAPVLDPAGLILGFGTGSVASAIGRGGKVAGSAAAAVSRNGRMASLANRGLIVGAGFGAAEGGLVEAGIAAGDPGANAGDVILAGLIGIGFGGTLGGIGGGVETALARKRLDNAALSVERARLDAEWNDVLDYTKKEQDELRRSTEVVENVKRQHEHYNAKKAEIEKKVQAELATGVPIPDAEIPSSGYPIFVTTDAGDALDRAEAYADFKNSRRTGGSIDGENPYRVIPVDDPKRSGVYTVVQEQRIGPNRVPDEDVVGLRQAISFSAAVELDLQRVGRLPPEPTALDPGQKTLDRVRPQDLMPPEMLEMFSDYASGAQHRRFVSELGEALGYDEGQIASAQWLLDEETFSDVAGRLIRGEAIAQEGQAPSLTFGLGAAGDPNASRGSFSALPDSIKGMNDRIRRLFRKDSTPEEIAAEIAAETGEEVDEEVVEALRNAAEARDVNKLPGDLSLVGRLTDAESEFSRSRFDTAGAFGRSKDRLVRMVGSGLVEDVIGKKGRAVQAEPISRFLQRETNREARLLQPVLNKTYNDWAKTRGTGVGGRALRKDRAEFNALVARAVRTPKEMATGDIADANVQKAADAIREQNKRLLALAKRHGILEDVPENSEYLARLYDHGKIRKAIDKYGEEEVVKLFKKAIAGRQTLDEELLDKVAQSMYYTIRNAKTTELDKLTVLRGGDRQTIVDTLEELQANGELGQLEPSDIDRIAAVLSPDPEQTAGQAGTLTSRQRRRVELDETMTISSVNRQTGKPEAFSFDDLLNNDAEAVQSMYAHQIIGAAGMNELLYAASVEAGEEIKTVPQLRRILRQRSLEADGEQYANRMFGGGKGNQNNTAFAYSTAWTLGRNRFDNNNARELATIARLHAMLARGGTFGIAGLPEAGRVAAYGGIQLMVKHVPGFRNFIDNARIGRLSKEEVEEFMHLVGADGEIHTFAYHARNDVFEDGVSDTVGSGPVGRTLGAAREGGRFLSRAMSFASGQAPLQNQLRQMALRGYAYRWQKLAHRGRGIGKQRLEAIGIDEATADKIAESIRNHGLDFDKWDAQTASDFIASGNRFISNVVQTNDPGQLPYWMSTPTAQTLTQFRSFAVGAYHGMLLRGLSIRDADEATMLLGSTMSAAVTYTGQVYLRSLGQEDPEEYRAERLSPGRIALATFQRLGVSSIMPDAINTVGYMAGLGAPFDFRNSGLPTGIAANPAVDTVNNFFGVSIFGEFSDPLIPSLLDGVDQRDTYRVQKMLPFFNLPGVENLANSFNQSVFDEPE